MKNKEKLILFFDYKLGYKIAKFLKKKKETVVGLVFDNKSKTPFKMIIEKDKKKFLNYQKIKFLIGLI